MTKHHDCEDRCQLLEYKGYHDCALSGRCELQTTAPCRLEPLVSPCGSSSLGGRGATNKEEP